MKEIFERHTDDLESRLSVSPVQVTIWSGNKLVVLSINSHLGTAATDIKTIESRDKVQGSTTAVYKRALDVMQQAATLLKAPIDYKFQTKNQSMIGFTLDPEKGHGLFEWDNYKFEENRFTAQKRINPVIQNT